MCLGSSISMQSVATARNRCMNGHGDTRHRQWGAYRVRPGGDPAGASSVTAGVGPASQLEPSSTPTTAVSTAMASLPKGSDVVMLQPSLVKPAARKSAAGTSR